MKLYAFLYSATISLALLTATSHAASTGPTRPVVQQNFKQLLETKACPGCDLAGADLTRVDLKDANLEGANLAGAKLYLANLANANLQGANLQGAALGGADLANADLRGANLTGAILEGAYLDTAKMQGKVVTSKPYEDEALAGVGEKVYVPDESQSKPMPFTQDSAVTESTAPSTSSQPVLESKGESVDPSPSQQPQEVKSKQAVAMSDAVVPEAAITDEKAEEPTAPPQEAMQERDPIEPPIETVQIEPASKAKTPPVAIEKEEVAPQSVTPEIEEPPVLEAKSKKQLPPVEMSSSTVKTSEQTEAAATAAALPTVKEEPVDKPVAEEPEVPAAPATVEARQTDQVAPAAFSATEEQETQATEPVQPKQIPVIESNNKKKIAPAEPSVDLAQQEAQDIQEAVQQKSIESAEEVTVTETAAQTTLPETDSPPQGTSAPVEPPPALRESQETPPTVVAANTSQPPKAEPVIEQQHAVEETFRQPETTTVEKQASAPVKTAKASPVVPAQKQEDTVENLSPEMQQENNPEGIPTAITPEELMALPPEDPPEPAKLEAAEPEAEQQETEAMIASLPPVPEQATPPVEEVLPPPTETGQEYTVATPEEVQARQQQLIDKLLDTKRCFECNLAGADLSGENLDESDLERANLSGANLEGIDLNESNLKGAVFSGANLRNADLRKADLYLADFSDADLTGAKFDKALIDSTDFTGAMGMDLEGANLVNQENQPEQQ